MNFRSVLCGLVSLAVAALTISTAALVVLFVSRFGSLLAEAIDQVGISLVVALRIITLGTC